MICVRLAIFHLSSVLQIFLCSKISTYLHTYDCADTNVGYTYKGHIQLFLKSCLQTKNDTLQDLELYLRWGVQPILLPYSLGEEYIRQVSTDYHTHQLVFYTLLLVLRNLREENQTTTNCLSHRLHQKNYKLKDRI